MVDVDLHQTVVLFSADYSHITMYLISCGTAAGISSLLF